MAWGAVAGAAISGAVSLIGGAKGSQAANQASQAQVASTQAANARLDQQAGVIRNNASQIQALNEPFRNTGVAANDRLAMLLGLSDPRGTPIYGDAPAAADPRIQGVARGNEVFNKDTGAYLGRYGIDPGVNTVSDLASYIGTSKIFDEQGNVIFDGGELPKGERPITGYTPNDASYGSLLKKFTADDLNADPVYQSGLQFGLDEGTGAINARAIAGGGYDSGATLKALTRFANDYGSTKAGDSYGRFMNDKNSVYGMLSGQQAVGMGATAADANALNTATNATTNLAVGQSNNMIDAGNARAAGIVGGANAWGNAATGVGNAYNSYQNSEILKKLMKPGAGYSTFGTVTPGYSNPYAFDPGNGVF